MVTSNVMYTVFQIKCPVLDQFPGQYKIQWTVLIFLIINKYLSFQNNEDIIEQSHCVKSSGVKIPCSNYAQHLKGQIGCNLSFYRDQLKIFLKLPWIRKTSTHPSSYCRFLLFLKKNEKNS